METKEHIEFRVEHYLDSETPLDFAKAQALAQESLIVLEQSLLRCLLATGRATIVITSQEKGNISGGSSKKNFMPSNAFIIFLRNQLVRNKMNDGEFAKKCGVSNSLISLFLNRKTGLGIGTQKKLIKAINDLPDLERTEWEQLKVQMK
ncbi:MAG: hypothetical protein AAB664_04310 [Patescibacteria group bacterium]